jgi:cytochrome c oxidase subunit III
MARSITHADVKGPAGPGAGQWGDGGGGQPGATRRASLTGLFVLLTATTMVFAAFTSAFWVRRGLSNDWQPTALPPILWVNTGVLLVSSAMLEIARRSLKAARRTEFNRYWTVGTGLGILFLLGQALAWRQLNDAGVFIATNPSSSFFYVLTAAHAVHVIGGISALTYVDVKALLLQLGPGKRTAVDVCALFWHFLDGLWVYLMILLTVWG